MAYIYVDPTATGDNDGGGDGAEGDITDSANWTDAYTNILDGINAVASGADTVYARGTQTISSRLTTTTGVDGVDVIGVGQDYQIGTGYFTIDGVTKFVDGLYFSTSSVNSWRWQNIRFLNCRDAVECTHANYWEFRDCVWNNCTNGVDAGGGANYWNFYRCIFDGCFTPLDFPDYLQAVACVFKNSGSSLATRYGSHYYGCLVLNCAQTTFQVNTGDVFFTNCVFHGNFRAINAVSTDDLFLAIGCRFTNNTTAINRSTTTRGIGNYFQGNGTDIANLSAYYDPSDTSVFGGTDTDYGYVDSANENFSLRDDATLRGAAITLPEELA
jgi:hypothetical protein